MKPDDDQLRPQQIDDEIERLMRRAQEETHENKGNAQFVQRLQHHYESEKQKKTLQRAWKSIAQRYEEVAPSSIDNHAQDEQSKLERSDQYTMYEQTTKIIPMKRNLPRWGTLVAVAVLALVIGSTALILSRAAAQRNGAPGTGGGGNHSTCLSTPTAASGRAGATPVPTAAPTEIPCCFRQPRVASEQSGATPVPTAAPTVVPCVPTPQPTVVPGSGPQPTVAPTMPTPTSISGPQPTVVPRPTPTPISGPQPTAVPRPTPTPVSRPQPTPTAAP
jgi:hypothetical protein